jgi:hypothetical protein
MAERSTGHAGTTGVEQKPAEKKAKKNKVRPGLLAGQGQ